MPNAACSAVAKTAVAWLSVGALALASDAITRVSIDSGGAEADDRSESVTTYYAPAISADGRHVAFDSWATNLVAADGNGVPDVFVHDRVTGATVRVSVGPAGIEADRLSLHPSISRDGRFVAFQSAATNLTAIPTSGRDHVFVHDRDPDGNGVFDEGNGITTLESVDANGIEGAGASFDPSISGDGLRVAFWSFATNLVSADTNGAADVFVRDRGAATTTIVSVSNAGKQGGQGSFMAEISEDGNVVVFLSDAHNLVLDTNDSRDVFVRDLVNQTTRRVSVDSSGHETGGGCDDRPSISSDGTLVAFMSWADDLAPNDTNLVQDCFVRDLVAGTTTLVSVDSAGVQGNHMSRFPSISGDGNVVAFFSVADDLVAGDDNLRGDVFLHDLVTGATTVSSRNCMGVLGDLDSVLPDLSADGRLVAFCSDAANLVPGDANGVRDVFVQERAVEIHGSWSNYGVGFAGTLGVPTATASGDPVFGADFTIDVGNSLGVATAGILLFGTAPASIPLNGSGTILVDFALVSPLVIDAAGTSVPARVPYDEALCGVRAYVQAIELDAGAAKHLSFTPGVEFVIGL